MIGCYISWLARKGDGIIEIRERLHLVLLVFLLFLTHHRFCLHPLILSLFLVLTIATFTILPLTLTLTLALVLTLVLTLVQALVFFPLGRLQCLSFPLLPRLFVQRSLLFLSRFGGLM